MNSNSKIQLNRRDDCPCTECGRHRPGCRDGCKERDAWDAEGERIKAARKKYYSGYVIGRRKRRL